MKKIKNKFIIWVILLLIILTWFQSYKYFNLNNIDRNSYALLVSWKWIINNNILYENEKKIIKIWDKIRTIWKTSILVLEWGDWSITRLWWNTTIIVNEKNISKDLTSIKVSFNLLSWKTWSNVINFMWSDSYFKEYFNDIEAWVRWTVFDVDLTKNYIYVTDHEVTLKTKDNKQYIVWENKPFSLDKFTFTDLALFLSKIRDNAWSNLNIKYDKDLINNLKLKLEDSIKNNKSLKLLSKVDIQSLNIKEKQKEYNKLLSEYQKYNFVDSSNEELFKVKLQIKSSLIQLADKENKIGLLKTVVYDINNAISLKKDSLIKNILPILEENKKLLPTIEFNNINNQINWLIKWLWQGIEKNIRGLMNWVGKETWDRVKQVINWVWKNIWNNVKGLINNFNK